MCDAVPDASQPPLLDHVRSEPLRDGLPLDHGAREQRRLKTARAGGSGSTQCALQIRPLVFVVIIQKCSVQRHHVRRHSSRIFGRNLFRNPLCGIGRESKLRMGQSWSGLTWWPRGLSSASALAPSASPSCSRSGFWVQSLSLVVRPPIDIRLRARSSRNLLPQEALKYLKK